MPGLHARLAGISPHTEGRDSGKLGGFQVSGYFLEMHRGQLGNAAAAKIAFMTGLNLSYGTADESELDTLIGYYQQVTDKEKFVQDLRELILMLQAGLFNFKDQDTFFARIQTLRDYCL